MNIAIYATHSAMQRVALAALKMHRHTQTQSCGRICTLCINVACVPNEYNWNYSAFVLYTPPNCIL